MAAPFTRAQPGPDSPGLCPRRRNPHVTGITPITETDNCLTTGEHAGKKRKILLFFHATDDTVKGAMAMPQAPQKASGLYLLPRRWANKEELATILQEDPSENKRKSNAGGDHGESREKQKEIR
jgi:hypothetical protein